MCLKLTSTFLLLLNLQIISLTYGILSVLVLVFNSRCDRGIPSQTSARDFFVSVIFRLYIQSEYIKKMYSVEVYELLTY